MCIRDRDPRDTYADASQWEEKAKDLASRFIKNFKKYEGNEQARLWSCLLYTSDVAGADAVALDVVLAVFRSDVLGEHLQAALGCSVGGDGLTAQLTHHGADVDDLAAALCDHVGDDGLCHDEGSVQIDVDDLTELGSAHLGHGDALDDTGVVDQNVDVANLLGDLCHHGVDGILIGHVADLAVSLEACFCVSSDALIHQMCIRDRG